MPDNDLKTLELIQASIASLDDETSDFNLPRTVPITILVDAGELSSAISAELQVYATELLGKFGYSATHLWGPFEGSSFITIFGTGRHFQDGDSFSEKLHAMAEDVANRLWKQDWKSNFANAGEVIKIAVAVGGIVTLIVAGPLSITLGSFVVPAKVLAILQGLGYTVSIVEGAKKLLFDSKQSVKALDEGQTSDHPLSSEYSVALSKPITVSRPLRLKKSNQETSG